MVSEKALNIFEKYEVLTNVELKSRYNIRLEKYTNDLEIEAKVLSNLVSTNVIPSGIEYQNDIANSIESTSSVLGDSVDLTPQKDLLKKVASLSSSIKASIDDLKETYEKGRDIEDEQACADFFCDTVKGKMDKIRNDVDELEDLTDDRAWQLPKFWEMLFIN